MVLLEAMVHIKYKFFIKKIKLIVIQLPQNTKKNIKQASIELGLRELRKIGHKFMKESLNKLKIGRGNFLTKVENEKFLKMFSKYDKAIAFAFKKINCVNPSIIIHLVIFIILYEP